MKSPRVRIFLCYISTEANVLAIPYFQFCFIYAAVEGSDFTVLMDELVFEVGSGNGAERCVNFTAISSDMAVEGFHHFAVIVNKTYPPINIDEYAQYLSVYIIDNDSKCKYSV